MSNTTSPQSPTVYRTYPAPLEQWDTQWVCGQPIAAPQKSPFLRIFPCNWRNCRKMIGPAWFYCNFIVILDVHNTIYTPLNTIKDPKVHRYCSCRLLSSSLTIIYLPFSNRYWLLLTVSETLHIPYQPTRPRSWLLTLWYTTTFFIISGNSYLHHTPVG